MFVYYFAHVARPFDSVASTVADTPVRWLAGCMAKACQEAAALERSDDGDARRGGTPQVSARLATGAACRGTSSYVLPLRVDVRGPDAPFSSLEADLEVGRLGPETTQLTLRGSYQVKRPAGGPEDGAAAHRIAEAAAKGFIERVVARIALTPAQPVATHARRPAEVRRLRNV